MNAEAADRRPEIQPADIAKMIEILRESGWSEAYLRVGEFELRLSSGHSSNDLGSRAPQAGDAASAAAHDPVSPAAATTQPARAPASARSAAPSPATPEQPPERPSDSSSHPPSDSSRHIVIRAESLGVFWRSPQPGAPPFVEIGDEVDEDTPLAIIEVMKMMTRVTPGCRGRVAAIHVDNGDTVEFDQPLLSIEWRRQHPPAEAATKGGTRSDG